MMALAWEMCISSWCNWYGRRKIDGHGVLQIHCLLVGHKIHTSHQRGRPCNVRFTYDKTSKQVSSSKMDAELSRTGCFSISTARPHTRANVTQKPWHKRRPGSHTIRGVRHRHFHALQDHESRRLVPSRGRNWAFHWAARASGAHWEMCECRRSRRVSPTTVNEIHASGTRPWPVQQYR